MVTDLGHLLDWPVPYPEAIPILIDGLAEAADPKDAEFHVRALTERSEADPVSPVVVPLFALIPDTIAKPHDKLRWAIGNAICETLERRLQSSRS